ncbi:hypothetical protein GQ457_15G007940 [Hibiscus cannabinus]
MEPKPRITPTLGQREEILFVNNGCLVLLMLQGQHFIIRCEKPETYAYGTKVGESAERNIKKIWAQKSQPKSYFDLSSLGTNEQVTMADSASVDQSLIFDLASSNEQISPRQVTRRLIITLFRIWYHWVRVTKPPWQTQHRLIRTQRRLTRVLLPICVIGYEWTGRFNRLSIVTTAGFVSFDRDFILILRHRVRMSRIYF